VCGLFIFQHIKKRIGKTHDGRGVQSFGIDTGVLVQGIKGPVDKGHGIEKKKFFFRHERMVQLAI
jgi:hypothetical protein